MVKYHKKPKEQIKDRKEEIEKAKKEESSSETILGHSKDVPVREPMGGNKR